MLILGWRRWGFLTYLICVLLFPTEILCPTTIIFILLIVEQMELSPWNWLLPQELAFIWSEQRPGDRRGGALWVMQCLQVSFHHSHLMPTHDPNSDPDTEYEFSFVLLKLSTEPNSLKDYIFDNVMGLPSDQAQHNALWEMLSCSIGSLANRGE